MGQKQSVTLLSVYNKRKSKHLRKLRIDDKFFKLLRKVNPNTFYNGNPMLLTILMDYKLTITDNIELKLQLIEALLMAGADTNIRYNSGDSNHGKNALMLIADCKYYDIDTIRLLFVLIEYGAIYKLDSYMVYPTLYSLCCFLENPVYTLFAEDIFDRFIDTCYGDARLIYALIKYDIKTIKKITSEKQHPTMVDT